MEYQFKSSISILLTIALFASCAPRQQYDDENDFIANIHGKTVEIVAYMGTNTDVKIPPRIRKLPVTAIGQGVFRSSSIGDRKLFTSVTIPKGVTHIGEEAFYWNKLTEIIIPNTVVSIGNNAFAYNELTSVKIPKSVTHIGYGAFWDNKIKNVVIPGTITEIGNAAFAFNDITEIVLPNRITKIGRAIFSNNKITSITIPEGVVSIEDDAFENNRLTELIIPKSVISIGHNAFHGNLTKVTIGDNVELDRGAISNFDYFYDYAVRKRGGTHIYSDHYWRPEDKSIPVYIFSPDDGWKSPDIEFLQDMPDLEDVTLRDNDLLTDITPLAELTQIKMLKIYDCPNIRNITPLSSLVNLESLYLTHNNNYDYGDIASLQKLESLLLYGDHLGEIDLSSIGQLRYLRFLDLSNGLKALTIKNGNKLQNLTNLETLRISGVDNLNISLISGLRNLINLEILDLTALDISDSSWMSSLRNLKKLEMAFCTINDVNPLAALPNLVEIDTYGCTIKDIAPLLRSNSLKRIRVFEEDVEAGISDDLRSRFEQKGIYLDTFRDTR